MVFRTWIGVAGLCGGLMHAQTAPPTTACPPVRDAQGNLVTNTNCSPGTPPAPAAQRFPYPGEVAPANPSVPAGNSPAAPQTDAPRPQSGEPSSKRFPYPGDPEVPSAPQPGTAAPGGARTAPTGPPLQDAGSSGQSSSSSGSSSSSTSSRSDSADGRDPDAKDQAARDQDARDPDANDPAAIPRRDRHKKPVVVPTPSDREQEDVTVAGFYYNDGNFKGSYDRAKDALTLDTDDPAAFLALANAARKLGKLDEAEKAYRRCLDLDPVPKVRRPAEKALREMTGG